jgi:hypothetical protein
LTANIKVLRSPPAVEAWWVFLVYVSRLFGATLKGLREVMLLVMLMCA